MKVNNLPDDIREYLFVIVRICCGEFWYYGACRTFERAQAVALEVDGAVVNIKNIF